MIGGCSVVHPQRGRKVHVEFPSECWEGDAACGCGVRGGCEEDCEVGAECSEWSEVEAEAGGEEGRDADGGGGGEGGVAAEDFEHEETGGVDGGGAAVVEGIG